MAIKPDDSEAPQLRRLQDWWLQLPLSYRLNALLYFLGVCFLLFLLTSVLRGGNEPRQIQVGAGTNPTTTTTAPRATSTVGPTTTVAGSTSSSTGPTTTAAASGQGPGGAGTTATTRASTNTTSGSSGTATTEATTTTVANTVGTVPASTTTTKPPCRNSTDPACGQFQWDPGPNSQPVNIGIPEIIPVNPPVNTEVTFRITVTDPDHVIGTCAYLDFGDLSSQGSCPEPPCPARYGPWDLPAKGGPGAFTFVFTHIYKTPGPFIATFLVDDRSDCWDPYGERRTKAIPVVVG